ncbi:AmmeMemoRadiSam system protein B [Candidatus Woesearchaeota archaeon]|nr:AmmeMemoRadiSam system protein B [Candidatus Woesearchaeota archaeon]
MAAAGSFYPDDSKALKGDIERYLRKAKNVPVSNLKALVVPHAGYVYSGIVAAAGYNLIRQLPKKHYKVILIGPSHYSAFYGISASKADYWETPLGKIRVTKSEFEEVEFSHLQEHCLEVQLPFLQITLKDFEILPLLLGEADPEETAEELNGLIDKDTIVIASSDLSHYHEYSKAVAIDSIMNDAVPKGDILKAKRSEACGIIPILTLMHMAKLNKWHAKFIDYKNSGDVTGDKKGVVGYGCYAFYGKEVSY